MPVTNEVTTIPELWDILFAKDSLTITLKYDQVQPTKAALSKYKAKQMKKLKGQIETLVLDYTAIRDVDTEIVPKGMCKLRIDLKRQGTVIAHAGITVNDDDLGDL